MREKHHQDRLGYMSSHPAEVMYIAKRIVQLAYSNKLSKRDMAQQTLHLLTSLAEPRAQSQALRLARFELKKTSHQGLKGRFMSLLGFSSSQRLEDTLRKLSDYAYETNKLTLLAAIRASQAPQTPQSRLNP